MVRVEDVWDRKWSGLLCAGVPLCCKQVELHCSRSSSCPGQGADWPSQRWEEAAPPVEMETHHELIIIIIQCLWAAVGSPSKREGSWSALGPSWMLLPVLRLPRSRRSPTTRPDRYFASCCSTADSLGIQHNNMQRISVYAAWQSNKR